MQGLSTHLRVASLAIQKIEDDLLANPKEMDAEAVEKRRDLE